MHGMPFAMVAVLSCSDTMLITPCPIIADPMKPLIQTLRAATESRSRALKFGWSRRKDHDATRISVEVCEQFVNSHPCASDALVRNWFRENSEHVIRVVIGGRDAGVLKQFVHE